VNFSPAGVTAEEAHLGDEIAAIQAKGSSKLFELVVPALVHATSIAQLEAEDDDLGASSVGAVPLIHLRAAGDLFATIGDRLQGLRIGAPQARLRGSNLSPVDAGGRDHGMWFSYRSGITRGGGLRNVQWGGTLGFDSAAGDSSHIGFAATVLSSRYAVKAPVSNGNTDTVAGIAYWLRNFGRTYMNLSLQVGSNSASFHRDLRDLGLTLASDVNFRGTSFAGRLEVGHTLMWRQLAITPFAAVAPAAIRYGEVQEQFSVGPGLHYRRDTVEALPTELGTQADGVLKVPGGALVVRLRAAWLHDFRPRRDIVRNFAELPEDSFTLSTLPRVEDAADLRGGVEYHLRHGLTLFGDYEGRISAHLNDYRATLGLRLVM
jgi:uncharacterized protein with beta-barrel porin domain